MCPLREPGDNEWEEAGGLALVRLCGFGLYAREDATRACLQACTAVVFGRGHKYKPAYRF